MKHADDDLRRLKPDPQAEADAGRQSREAREAQDSWSKAFARDPQLAGVQHRNAVAARMLVTLHDSHQSYPNWVSEYRTAGDELLALWAMRRGST